MKNTSAATCAHAPCCQVCVKAQLVVQADTLTACWRQARLSTCVGSAASCFPAPADVHAGNLLVLPDGRVGFIDFGIVGRIRRVPARRTTAWGLALAAQALRTVPEQQKPSVCGGRRCEAVADCPSVAAASPAHLHA